MLAASSLALLLALVLALALGARGQEALSVKAGSTLATVTSHGGLCPREECRTAWTITTDDVRDESGKLARRLDDSQRDELVSAIAQIDYGQIVKHPFGGTCPTAYDGSERIYRFHGLDQKLATCTFDLEGVEAVRLVNALID